MQVTIYVVPRTTRLKVNRSVGGHLLEIPEFFGWREETTRNTRSQAIHVKLTEWKNLGVLG